MGLGFLDEISTILQSVVVVGTIIIGAYYIWRTSRNTTKDDTIKAYKEVINAYTLKITEFEKTLNEIRDENKSLQAQVNQLVGENKALKNVIVKPDDEFKNTVTSILGEMRTIREDFLNHTSNDDDKFGNLAELARANNSILHKLTSSES